MVQVHLYLLKKDYLISVVRYSIIYDILLYVYIIVTIILIV